jgi:hypothetical protein
MPRLERAKGWQMLSIFDDPAHWRERAQEARIIANQLKDPEAKLTMLDIAAGYELLAGGAEQRNKRTPKES